MNGQLTLEALWKDVERCMREEENLIHMTEIRDKQQTHLEDKFVDTLKVIYNKDESVIAHC